MKKFQFCLIILISLSSMLNISAQTNWTIVSPSSAPILSHTPYNLRSTKDNSILAYLKRKYGIHLSWGTEGTRPAIFQFVKEGGGPIKCGDRIGLMNDDGGYIFYRKRPAGINLSFSDTPSYEWEIRTVDNVKGAPILPGQPIGLFNTVTGDFVRKCTRAGQVVDLAWVLDCLNGWRIPTKYNAELQEIIKYKKKLEKL